MENIILVSCGGILSTAKHTQNTKQFLSVIYSVTDIIGFNQISTEISYMNLI